MASKHSLICYAKRTPIGKMSGAFASVPAPELGATLVRDALKTTGLDGGNVSEIIMGCVLPAGIGQAPARQAGIRGGLPHSVSAMTLNKVCGSGLKAIMLGDQAIRLGDAEVVFAGGMESMTRAPHLLMDSRAGYRFGSVEVKDHMQYDGLWDPYSQVPMGNCGELCAKEYRFTREEQDKYAQESYTRARQSTESGHFAREIVSVEVTSRKGSVVIEKDEEPFSVDLDKMKTLRPAFDKEGTITAGNASSINDGAALTVLASEDAVKKHGLKPIARIVAQASFAQDPNWFTTAPIGGIKRVLQKAGLNIADIDVFEINEAFAVVPMAAARDLEIPANKLNPFGGAIALGHPIGASGARVMATLLNGLAAKNGKLGLATLCIGGGEASAVIVERL